MGDPTRPAKRPARSRKAQAGAATTRTVLKFDSGRRGFTRAIVTLAVSAAGLLAFAVYFFWHLL